jgi:microcystin-dependent protein
MAHQGRAIKEAIPMKLFLSGLTLFALLACIFPRSAPAQATNPYLGEIQTFAFNFCPSGWVPLNGQLLAISQYEALFNLLGTTYGGDGVNTFAVPKWGPIRVANGATLQPCIALQGVFPSQN